MCQQFTAMKNTRFQLNIESMPSGETRIRLLSDDENNYSRTENGSSGVWQRAHHHKVLAEIHIVEKG
jgi:hypothetical protein